MLSLLAIITTLLHGALGCCWHHEHAHSGWMEPEAAEHAHVGQVDCEAPAHEGEPTEHDPTEHDPANRCDEESRCDLAIPVVADLPLPDLLASPLPLPAVVAADIARDHRDSIWLAEAPRRHAWSELRARPLCGRWLL